MAVDHSAEVLRLRATVRDLLALSSLPEVWVGREPHAIAAELADVMLQSLQLDFAFVRLCDTGCQAAEVMRGDSWRDFPDWLQQRVAVGRQISRTEIVTDSGGVDASYRGIVIPIGVDGQRGLVAAACGRSDFPNQIDRQLLSVAASNAATAVRNAHLINKLRCAHEALRQNEQELRNARDELEARVAERTAELAHVMRVSALGELAASIAHEVSQPLAAISADATAALNWLGFQPPNIDGAREALTAIDADCQRAGNVLSRINALLKRAPFQRTACDLNAIVSGIVPLVRPQFEARGVALETELDGELRPIVGDAVQLQQVLINLLLNAADACRSLEVERRRVVVRTATERRNGATWSVASVADTGKGIEPEVRARIFDAFYTTKSDGLGMGLSISRSIVLRHDGELAVAPNPPNGATFAVRLPSLL